MMALAIVTVSGSLSLAGVGAFLALPRVIGVPTGVVLMLVAAILRPRLGWIPRGSTTLQRTCAPELFSLLDEIGDAVDAKPVDVVVLAADFDAAAGIIGLRRRRVIWIG